MLQNTRRGLSVGTLAALLLGPVVQGLALQFPVVETVEVQPLKAQVDRLVDAMEQLGSPFADSLKDGLQSAFHGSSPRECSRRIQELLDPLCLAGIHINPESRVKVESGSGPRELVQNGWRSFLVKVRNEAGVTSELRVSSPQALPLHNAPADQVEDRWLDLAAFSQQPLPRTLGGLALEYRILSLYSRDAGKRDATLFFDVGQGTQDLAFRNGTSLLFDCLPSQALLLRVHDERGQPTTACFEFRDQLGRVFPSQAKRLAPDFAFHPQIYRGDGETVRLPAGEYSVSVNRGPESVAETRTLRVGDADLTASFRIRRWIDPSLFGYWSGDHHIHAAGCAHYESPTQGVHAPDMMRHCLGEDLKVGCNLTWGPCFDYQKQFFTGRIDPVSASPYLLRYDVEVSGFGSHQSGHLCLLRLVDQMYPGGNSTAHWPTLGLNTLKWAKRQGAVCGPAHSGFGLQISDEKLPSFEVPPFDGIGANEYIVDVTHRVPGPDGELVPAVDFLATVDTPYPWELNIWYHTLNCGFRTRISGETDFPCIYGERVGLGRSYVRLDGDLDFDAWCEGIRSGRSYVSDGLSHLIDFRVNGNEAGVGASEVHLQEPGTLKVTVRAAARLAENPIPGLADRPCTERPYWHLERARLPGTQRVPVELVINGEPVARQEIVADGSIHDLEFGVPVEKSSWVALRVLPSSHTNPVFVIVDEKPVRASRRSAEWCLAGVSRYRSQKQRFIRPDELEDFEAAWRHAEETYRKIVAESR